MSLTTDPNHPDLGRGIDKERVGQNKVYLVLSQEEIAKGFVRPLRRGYTHVGQRPKYPLRDMTDEERQRYGGDYVMYEVYPESESPVVGRGWTRAQLDAKGCGTVTTMGLALCETYARQPTFYGATYCCGCMKHLPVAEFTWVEDGEVVGS